MTKTSESRMSRWSRLKTKQKPGNDKYQALAAAPEDIDGEHAGSTLKVQSMPSLVDQDQPTDVNTLGVDAQQLDQEPDLDTIAEELELPKIDDLTDKSDFTLFLDDKVPEALKKAAMRKLWLSNPIFANLDGLNDYDEDYNIIDKLITALDTDYQVGRGFLDPDEDEDESETPEAESPETKDDVLQSNSENTEEIEKIESNPTEAKNAPENELSSDQTENNFPEAENIKITSNEKGEHSND